MASPRTQSPLKTRLGTLAVLVTAAVAAVTVLPAQISQAEPRPTIEQVQQRIDALNAKIELANEEYDGAKLDLVGAKRNSAVTQARLRAAQGELDKVKLAMGALAAAAYRTGGADQFVQLVTTSSPQTFLDRAAGLDRIAASQRAQMSAAATARHRLASVQAEATAQEAAQARVAAEMAKQKQTIESALAQQQQLMSSLRADEQRRLVALREARLRAAIAQAAAARRAAERASRTRTVTSTVPSTVPSRVPSAVSPSTGGTYNGPASGRAGVAVREAYDKLGSPYEWGAAGPDRFDCSGLTMWVWGKAGVSLPHQSRAQYAGGRKVAKSDLQPGDLTFYGSPIHHVGIYIGNGQMISAPHTGDVVKIQDAFRSDYVGAVRP